MTLFRGFLLTSASQVVNLAAALVTRVFMARLLGPERYGGLGVGLNMVTVVTKVLAFGTVPAVQYYGSKPQEDRKDCLRTVLAIGIVLGIGLTALSVVGLPQLMRGYFHRQPVAASVHPFLAVGILPIVLGGVLASLLIPWGRIAAYSVIQVVPGLLIPVSFGVCVAITGPLTAAVVGYLISWGTALFYNLWVVRGDMRGGHFQWTLAKRIVRYGFAVWPNVVLAVGSARLAVLVGAGFVGEADIGLFVVALNLVEGVFAFHSPIGQLLFTRVSEREGRSFAVVQESMRVSLFVLLTVAAAFVAVGRPVLLLLFGRAFASSWPVSLVLVGTGVCHALMRILNNFLAGMGRPSRNTVTLAVETAVLLALIPVLARGGSIMGLAVASVVSALVALLVATVQSCRMMHCSPADFYVPRRSDFHKTLGRVRTALSRSAGAGSTEST